MYGFIVAVDTVFILFILGLYSFLFPLKFFLVAPFIPAAD